MKNIVKTLILSVVFALGLAPVATLAAPTTTVVVVNQPIKKAGKPYQLAIDSLLMKKTYLAGMKKTPAVQSVDDEATSVPSTAYMQALEKAMDSYLSARAKAGGNKKKVDAAEEAYTLAVEEATELYLIPITDTNES